MKSQVFKKKLKQLLNLNTLDLTNNFDVLSLYKYKDFIKFFKHKKFIINLTI